MDGDELPDLADRQRRVLAICGGGYAGLFAAEFLARLERRLGQRPLGEVFDLIAGTSIGGLLALGLAKGMRAAELPPLLTELGPVLFSRSAYGLFRAKYDAAPLVDKVADVFGDTTLSSLTRRVLIPAVNMTGGETLVFSNGPNDPTASRPVREAALATSAAPWYLPPHQADRRLYADGGLVANSPEALAAIEAVHGRGWPRDRVKLLVVGSTQVSARLPGHLLGARWGLLDWVRDGRLLTTAMRAQMSLARMQARSVLGSANIIEADVELNAAEQKRVALNKAAPGATHVLETLAKETFERFCADHPLLVAEWSAGPGMP
nr:CBASS cGAMP-activated phospholipase [uncultured Rhodopila sp.]